MKHIFIQLPVIATILVILGAIFIIIFYLTRDKAIASIFQKIVIFIFFLSISGLKIFEYYHFNIANLGYPKEGELEDFVYRFFLAITYVAVFVVLKVNLKSIFTNLILLFRQQLLGIYIGIAAFSMFWSDTPLRPLQATLGLVILGTFAVYFGRRYNWQALSRLLRWLYSILALSTVFTAIFIPSIGVFEDKGWTGLFIHPAYLAEAMGLNAILWLFNFLYESKYRWRSLTFFILSIILMQFANTATTLIGCIFSILILVLIPLIQRINWRQAVIFFLLSLLASAGAFILILSSVEQVVSSLNRDITFTGRIPLWEALIDLCVKQQRLWLGYGYDSFWLNWRGADNPAAPILNSPAGIWQPHHAHNAFVEIILYVGLFGLLVFIASYSINIIRAIKLANIDAVSESSTLPLALLSYIFFFNLAASTVNRPSLFWFLYVLITVRLQIDTRKKSRNFSVKQVSKNQIYLN
ncbi:MAG: O-antigen ligase family protein [Xenococcaceae cyanobacterium]